MPVNLGEALIALIGGGAQGFLGGRKYAAEQKIAAEEREHKRATEERVFEQRQNKINEQIAGREEMFGLLEAAGGISPRTPADEVLKIKAQYLDAADRAGHDLKTAQALFDDAVMSRKPQQLEPISPTDQALINQRNAAADRHRAATQKARQQVKQLKDNDLNQTIDEFRQVIESIEKSAGGALGVDDSGYEEYITYKAYLDAAIEEQATRKGLPAKRVKRENPVKSKADVHALMRKYNLPIPGVGQQQYPTATNPQTGEKLIYKDGQWQKIQ